MNKKKNLPTRYFQYIDGENKGKVVKLVGMEDFEGETMFEFDDGESMFVSFVSPMTTNKKSLDKKFMVEVKSPSEKHLWRFDTVKETRIDLGNMESQMAPPLDDILNADSARDETGNFALKDSALGKSKLLFPIDTMYDPLPLPTIEWMYDTDTPETIQSQTNDEAQPNDPVQQAAPAQRPVQQQVRPVIEDTSQTADEKAIAILVGRAKKTDTDVELTITLGLPSKDLYKIAESNFDNGGDLFIKEIVKSLTHDMIVDSIRAGLKEAYSQE